VLSRLAERAGLAATRHATSARQRVQGVRIFTAVSSRCSNLIAPESHVKPYQADRRGGEVRSFGHRPESLPKKHKHGMWLKALAAATLVMFVPYAS
jgi:hypothetical protein